MKLPHQLSALSVLVSVVGFATARAADDANGHPVSTTSQETMPRTVAMESPDPDAIRRELAQLKGAERAAKLNDYRERYGKTDPSRQATRSRPSTATEWRNLSSEERVKYLESLQQTTLTDKPSAEQNTEHLRRTQAAIERKIKHLQTKRQVGTITAQESRFLDQRLRAQRRVRARIGEIDRQTKSKQQRSGDVHPEG